MDRAGRQAAGKSIHSKVLASKHDLADRAIVRQHADDNAAVEQVGDFRGRPQAACRELADPLGVADMTACGSGIAGHRRAHPTEAHKSNIACDRIARDLGARALSAAARP
jgi:hypothetical protein